MMSVTSKSPLMIICPSSLILAKFLGEMRWQVYFIFLLLVNHRGFPEVPGAYSATLCCAEVSEGYTIRKMPSILE